MNKQFLLSKVVEFRGYNVNNGTVELYDSEYRDFIDEVYEPVVVCGYTYNSGALIESVDPIAFGCGKSDYESELTSELEQAVDNEDFDSIEFEEGFDIDEYLENLEV